jgi:hypothetical protein
MSDNVPVELTERERKTLYDAARILRRQRKPRTAAIVERIANPNSFQIVDPAYFSALVKLDMSDEQWQAVRRGPSAV